MRQKQRVFSLFLLSPSSWRAWIEIRSMRGRSEGYRVALLMEGVDRNLSACDTLHKGGQSPSSWRAWIEIDFKPCVFDGLGGRPPHGGRG